MIDSHIHVLPGIDDGAADIDMALHMASVAVDEGIHTLICTPHDLNSIYQNPRTRVLERVNQLQSQLTDNNLALTLHPGAELHLDVDLANKVLEGEALTLADKNKHVLIEFPKLFVPHGAVNILEQLIYNGYTPIIAHPERNPTFVKHVELLNEYVDIGCKIQLTAMSVTGQFSTAIQSVCKQWCHQGMVHIVASDAHRPTGRAPKLAMAHQTLKNWVGDESADTLIISNPNKIIQGEELEDITVTEVSHQSHRFKKPLLSMFWSKK